MLLSLALLGELFLVFVLYAIAIGSQGACTAEFGEKVAIGSPRYEACNLKGVLTLLFPLAFLVIPVAATLAARRRGDVLENVMWMVAATVVGLLVLVAWVVLLQGTSRT